MVLGMWLPSTVCGPSPLLKAWGQAVVSLVGFSVCAHVVWGRVLRARGVLGGPSRGCSVVQDGMIRCV